jgi:hypothetical protein
VERPSAGGQARWGISGVSADSVLERHGLDHVQLRIMTPPPMFFVNIDSKEFS